LLDTEDSRLEPRLTQTVLESLGVAGRVEVVFEVEEAVEVEVELIRSFWEVVRWTVGRGGYRNW